MPGSALMRQRRRLVFLPRMAPMSEPIDPNKAVDFLLANAGKYARAKAERIHIEVSIHTRHYWRVKPPSAAACAPRHAFQSTPAITGG